MTPAEFHAARRFAATPSGRIAYIEAGTGPVALFIHGVPLNGYFWRHVIAAVQPRRRCVALDLMGLGYSEVADSQDLSFAAQARMVQEFLDALGIAAADLMASDSGGAVAQIFAAAHPQRVRSLTLANCDVHDGWPPAATAPYIDAARQGVLADMFGALRHDVALARSDQGLAGVYAHPEVLDSAVLDIYLALLVASDARRRQFNRYWTSFDPAQTVAAEAGLRALSVPALIVWALDDPFFEVKWAYWLRGTLPGARPVIEVPGARLFFAEDQPGALSAPLAALWRDMDGASGERA